MSKKKILAGLLAVLVITGTVIGISQINKETPAEPQLGEINTNNIVKPDDNKDTEGDTNNEGIKVDLPTANDAIQENPEHTATKKGFFISREDANKFVEENVRYNPNDELSFIREYGKAVMAMSEDGMSIVKNEDYMILNFYATTPLRYVENPAFKKAYMQSGGRASGITVSDEGLLKMLEGYYRTVKANFSDVKYVYFQLSGDPWEVIPGKKHAGLLFLEPGQERPKKAPIELYLTLFEKDMLQEDGFPKSFVVPGSLAQPTQNVITVDNKENEEPTAPEDNKETNETPVVEDKHIPADTPIDESKSGTLPEENVKDGIVVTP